MLEGRIHSQKALRVLRYLDQNPDAEHNEILRATNIGRVTFWRFRNYVKRYFGMTVETYQEGLRHYYKVAEWGILNREKFRDKQYSWEKKKTVVRKKGAKKIRTVRYFPK